MDVEKRSVSRGWQKPRGLDRPIVGVVGMDVAYSGKSGFCVLPHPVLKPGFALQWREGLSITEATSTWLGEACASLCRPGERLLFVAEADAFGGQAVARKLGMAVGAIEGLLLDLHAIEPDTRIDAYQATWRRATLTVPATPGGKVRPLPRGRATLKRAAIAEAERRYGIRMPEHAAEGTLIATWCLERLLEPTTQEGSE